MTNRTSTNLPPVRSPVASDERTAYLTKPTSEPLSLLAIKKLGLNTDLLRGLDHEAIRTIETAALNWLGRRDSVAASKLAVNAASKQAKRLEREVQNEERHLVAEVNYLIDEARVAAERVGAPFGTRVAIASAVKNARTGRQRLALLLRLSQFEAGVVKVVNNSD